MIIRKAKKEDIEQLIELRKINLEGYSKVIEKKPKIDSDYIRKGFENIFSSHRCFLLVAESNKKIRGYLTGSLVINSYHKKAYIFITGFDSIIERNNKRKEEGKFINNNVYMQMMRSFSVPTFEEFDSIEWIWS